MFRLCLALVISLLCLAPPSARGSDAPPITICADPDPPPWTYWKLDAHGKKTGEFIGSSVDIVRAVFNQLHREVKFIGDLPWKRCLYDVENGQIDFAMDAYFDTARAAVFDYSIHYSTLTPQLFYLTANPLIINSVGDLKKYHGCGILGSSYMHYGLTDKDLDLGSGYDSLYRKIHARRCDYFLEELEVISGFKLIGRNYIDDSLVSHKSVLGAVAPSKYLITVKNGKNSHLLVEINAALNDIIKSGQAQRIWGKYAPGIPFKY